MKLKKIITVLFTTFLILTLGNVAQSQDLARIPGAFVDIGLGLRPLGMGGAYSALATDENAARWNPAALSAIKDPTTGFSWTNQFDQEVHNYISVSYPQIKGMGIGVYGISSGDDVYREMTIGVAAGVEVEDNLHIGLTLKYLSTSFGNDEEGGAERSIGSSAGYSIDIGFLYQPTKDVSLAFVMRDIFNGINWDSEFLDGGETVSNSYAEGLARKVVLSMALEREKSTFAIEYLPGLYSDVEDRVALGAEFTILKILRPRFGFAQNLASGYTNQWMTMGLGIVIKSEKLGPIRVVNFGYTHLFHETANSPRVGLSLGW